MEENKEKQQDTAFGARINKFYENLFNDDLNKYKDEDGNLPRGAKKRLLEKVIYEYYRNKKNQEKEDVLSLESEISLVASNLDNILGIFKTIKGKAQDTLIAERTNSQQTIKNYETDLETEKSKNNALESRNKELELSNETFEEVKANLLEQIEKLKEDNKNIKEDLQSQKLENANLLKTNNSLEKADHESKEFITELKNKVQSAKDEIQSLKSLVKTNEETILSLQSRTKNLQEANDDLRKSKENDIEEIKKVLKEKMEVQKEKEILDIMKEQHETQKEVNTVQLKNIELIGVLNSKEMEIANLNIEIEKYKNMISEITGSDKKKGQ